MTWQKLSSSTMYKNRYMTVTEDELVTDHGDKVIFGIVHKEPAVQIIPWDGERVTIISQYRYPVDHLSWEFPAGHMEHNNIEVCALAELEEEAGLKAQKIIEIGTFAIAPGHLTQICHVFLATDLFQGQQNLEPAEKGMQIKTVNLAELNQMIINHEITDGLTLSSLKLFELYLVKHPR